MRFDYLKFLAIFFAFLLVAGITLLALDKISEIMFWAVVAICAIFAYWVLPQLKK